MHTVNQKSLYTHVDFLTSIYPYRNYKNPDSLRKAADYIDNELAKNGFVATRQKWEVDGITYENTLASYQPEKKRRFVIGAHYDVYKDQPGADDNASSVAGLLEISRLIINTRNKPDYGIDFVFFSLEEPPFFKKKEMGSYVHAKWAYEQKQDIIGMLALEMIGYYRERKEERPEDRNFLMVSGIKKYDNFNKKISGLLRIPTDIDSRRLSFADDYRNNGPSDHRNYWKFDYPGVMIIGTGGQGNPNYHKESDRIETLDFDIMTRAVESIAFAALNFDKDTED